jgi:carbon storage regulator CsrA
MLRPSRKRQKEAGDTRGSLVLARYPGEAIVIDSHTEVEILRITDGRVYLRIVSPKQIPIVRKELINDDHK